MTRSSCLVNVHWHPEWCPRATSRVSTLGLHLAPLCCLRSSAVMCCARLFPPCVFPPGSVRTWYPWGSIRWILLRLPVWVKFELLTDFFHQFFSTFGIQLTHPLGADPVALKHGKSHWQRLRTQSGLLQSHLGELQTYKQWFFSHFFYFVLP